MLTSANAASLKLASARLASATSSARPFDNVSSSSRLRCRGACIRQSRQNEDAETSSPRFCATRRHRFDDRQNRQVRSATLQISNAAPFSMEAIMSDLDRACLLDGQRAIFVSFDGPNRFIVLVGLEERIVTRDQWMALPTFLDPRSDHSPPVPTTRSYG
jgi:hypothetical protein